jgi:hypothetical protein
MRTLYKTTLFLAVGAFCMGIGTSLRAQTTIFDNSVNDLVTRFNPGTYQVGDEILLAGTARYLTYFSFEYWGTSGGSDTAPSFSAPITATVTFYENDGSPFNGYATPGTSFFSESFSVSAPTPRKTFIFTAGTDFASGGLFIPTSDMTWSVQFSGMGATDDVGVDIYAPPTVGSDYPDYWQNDGTAISPSWVLLTNTVPMDFAALMQANETVPEPSSLALLLAGGLGILTLARRLRHKA